MSVKWDETALHGELKVKTERLQGIAARRIEALTKIRINELVSIAGAILWGEQPPSIFTPLR